MLHSAAMARRLPNAKEDYLRVTAQLPADVAAAVKQRASADQISLSASVVALLRGGINSADKQLAQACRLFVTTALTSPSEEQKRQAADNLTREVVRITISEIGGMARRYPGPPISDGLLAAESAPGDGPVQSVRREIQSSTEKNPAT